MVESQRYRKREFVKETACKVDYSQVNQTRSVPRSGDLKRKIQHEQKQELCPRSRARVAAAVVCRWNGPRACWGCRTEQGGLKTTVQVIWKNC